MYYVRYLLSFRQVEDILHERGTLIRVRLCQSTPPLTLNVYKTISYALNWVNIYTTFYTKINHLFEDSANGSHVEKKRPPVPSLILGLQKRGLKGRLLLLLFRLSAGSPSNELILQPPKVYSESVGRNKRLTLLYDTLRGSQGR